MRSIQEAIAAYLQDATGIPTVCDRTEAAGVYPLLAVSIRGDGTVLIAGGRQAEHTYQVTVTAASDRDRAENTTLLSDLPVWLLRGIPAVLEGEGRILHPLGIATEGDELTFSLTVCLCVPPLANSGAGSGQPMQKLHLEL